MLWYWLMRFTIPFWTNWLIVVEGYWMNRKNKPKYTFKMLPAINQVETPLPTPRLSCLIKRRTPPNSERLQRLFDVLAVQQRAHLDSLVGQTVQVLVEGPNDASTRRFTGRSERHEIVHLEAPAGVDPTGQLVEVTVERAFRHSLLGRMAGATIPEKPTPRPQRRRLPVVGEAGA